MSLDIQPTENGYLLASRVVLAGPLDTVFPFFADCQNLDKLTPASLRFEILTPPPITMRQGLILNYRIRLHGLPIRWRSEITAWDPPHRFIDEQRRGPYRWWRHEHVFQETDGRTAVTDRVDYRPRGGRLVHRLFVGPDLRRIFTYRTERLIDLFR